MTASTGHPSATATASASAAAEALLAAGPHPSLGAHADTYGRLIGRWTGEVRNHMVAGPPQTASIEVSFAWALDGRAVQDTWITPSRADRAAGRMALLHWFGTTLRVFDPNSESWRTLWWDPESAIRIELEGRRQGDDIVQLGTRGGRPIRWTFSRITRDSLLWQGHILEADGATWRLEVEVLLRRAD
ncbi:MAG TPA: hypothetical protein VKB80_26345 [Kofleriaceae bacterium]|nr:hypothetical protein [Kofleriaceae bacterium]